MMKNEIVSVMFWFWIFTSMILVIGYWIFGETPYSIETLFLLLLCSAIAVILEIAFIFGLATIIDFVEKPKLE
jgi:magnesium-transporting ATPase (P-type)